MNIPNRKNIAFMLRHRKYTILLVSIIVYLFSFSFSQSGVVTFVGNLGLTFLLIAAINASHEVHSKKTYVYGIIVILSIRTSQLSIHLTTSHAILIILFLTWVTLRFLTRLLKDKKIDIDYLSGAVAGYMLLGLIGGYLGILTETIMPFSFHISTDPTVIIAIKEQITFIYRSFTTLSTLGYGDIIPVLPISKSLSILLVVFGQVYLTILLGIMLSKFVNIEKK